MAIRGGVQAGEDRIEITRLRTRRPILGHCETLRVLAPRTRRRDGWGVSIREISGPGRLSFRVPTHRLCPPGEPNQAMGEKSPIEGWFPLFPEWKNRLATMGSGCVRIEAFTRCPWSDRTGSQLPACKEKPATLARSAPGSAGAA